MISGFPEKREFDDTSSVSSIRRSRRSGRRLQVWINIVFRCNRSFLASSCTQELQALFGCLKKWEFDDTPCGKQHPAYMDCVHTAQRAAAEFKEAAKKVSFVIMSMFWQSSLLWSSCFHFLLTGSAWRRKGMLDHDGAVQQADAALPSARSSEAPLLPNGKASDTVLCRWFFLHEILGRQA